MDVLDRLLTGLRQVCAGFPDKRKGGASTYSMADIGLSAFSLFFMQSESFLAYQRGLEEGRKSSNCRTLFGMAKIPTVSVRSGRSAADGVGGIVSALDSGHYGVLCGAAGETALV